jgi:Polysaccharide deacetylase
VPNDATCRLRQNPAAARAVVESGYDIYCHGWRWVYHSELNEIEEREHIRRAAGSIRTITGERPAGWYCRYAPSENTRRLVVEANFGTIRSINRKNRMLRPQQPRCIARQRAYRRRIAIARTAPGARSSRRRLCCNSPNSEPTDTEDMSRWVSLETACRCFRRPLSLASRAASRFSRQSSRLMNEIPWLSENSSQSRYSRGSSCWWRRAVGLR